MDMTRKSGLALAALAALGFAATAPAQAQTLYNTGVDSNGSPLGDGATELHYTLVNVPAHSTTSVIVRKDGFGYPLPNAGPYLPNNSTSAWIGPANAHDLNGPDGYYDYQTTFTLSSSNYVVSGNWATDNTGVAIKINGQSTGNHIGLVTDNTGTPGFYNYTPFTISSGLQTGQNTLDFIVYNAHYDAFPNDNPTALRVDGITATVAPEPSSFAVFGFLGLGMAGLMLKARKRSAASAA